MPRTRLAVGLACACAASALCASPARAQPRVLVFPGDRHLAEERATAEVVVRQHGLGLADGAAVVARLEAAAAADQRAEAAALEHTGQALEAARADYVQQHWAAMIERLQASESGADLPYLARPAGRRILADLEVLLGMAYLGRAQPGDRERALDRFALSARLDPAAAPTQALVGPAVARAYQAAGRDQAARPSHVVQVALRPADASLTVDGKPASAGEPLTLPDGVHVLAAQAPGFAGIARVVTVSGATQVDLTLAAAPDPLAGLAFQWRSETLAAAHPSELGALRAVSRSAHADALLFLGRQDAKRLARMITPHAAGAAVTAADTRAAADLALTDATRQPARHQGSIFHRWWFWTAVGVVAVGAGAAYAISTRADRLEVVAR